jgi:hypothetical protein
VTVRKIFSDAKPYENENCKDEYLLIGTSVMTMKWETQEFVTDFGEKFQRYETK